MVNDTCIYTGLKPYPDDFDELFYLIQSEHQGEITEELNRNKFFKWLNKKYSSFYQAKQKMIKKNLISSKDLVPTNQVMRLHLYALEYIVAICTHYFVYNEPVLKQTPALKQEIDNIKNAMMTIKQCSETEGIMPFENIMVYQILLRSIDMLLEGDKKRSIYSFGKAHPQLAREVLFRWLVKSLFQWYLPTAYHEVMTNQLVKDIALDLTEQFYEPRIANVSPHIVQTIRQEVMQTHELGTMTISKFLGLPEFQILEGKNT